MRFLRIPDFHFLGLTAAEKKILFAVFSILTAMCTLAYIAHRKSQQLISSAAAIEQSEEIKYHIQEVKGILVEMETGMRGYILTQDEAYMAPAIEAIAEISVHLHQLSELPGITPEEIEQINRLKDLSIEKSSIVTRTAELMREEGPDGAKSFIEESKDKALMMQVRTIADDMTAKEEAKLGDLRKEYKGLINHFAITYYLLLGKISITVITVIVLFILYLRQRNKSEKVLKESHDLFQNVLDHTSAIISIKDLSGRYILINKAFGNLLGTPKDTVKGNTVFDLFDKRVAQSVRDTDLEVIRTQEQIKVEEMIEVNGEMRHFTSVKFPLFDRNKIPYAICSISTDDTEMLESEQHHRKEMNRILDLFNNAPCGYQSSDSNGIIIEINDTLLKWLGYKRHEVVGKLPVRNIISPESIQVFQYYFPKLKSGEIKSLYEVEVTYLRKDGSKFTVVANSMGAYDDEGNFLNTRTSVFDISYRKRVEETATKN